MLETLWQDIRYAARSLRHTPAFTAAAVITLALGIGANSAMFSLLNAVVLRTLPVPAPHELSLLWREAPPAAGDVIGGLQRSDIFAYTAVQRLERALPADVQLAAMSSVARFDLRLTGDGRTTPVSGQLVSGGYFSALGVVPAAGRLIGAADNQTVDGHPVAVVSYGFSQRQFGGPPAAIGRTIPINRVPFTIVGVAQPGFTGVWFGNGVELWLPVAMQHAVGYRQNVSTNNAEDSQPWLPQSGIEWLNIVIRSATDAKDAARNALALAYQQEIALEGARRGDDDPENRRLLQSHLTFGAFAGGFSSVRTQFSGALAFLMVMVTLLLLIACANIANLLLARATVRRREIAVRLSLGSGRWPLVRQLLVESLLISTGGCLAALPLAQWLSASLAEVAVVRNALPQGFELDGRVLLFTVGLATITGLLFGLLPAFRATSLHLTDALKGANTSGMPSGSAAMRPLVMAQVALSVLLVVAAALFGRSLVNLLKFDPGFEREQLVFVRIARPTDFISTPAQWRALETQLRERVRAVPGVVRAEFSLTGTASGTRRISGVTIEGYLPLPGEIVRLQENVVGREYFSTVGMVLREGRAFTELDTEGGPKVAVVNETAVRRYFSGRSPVGKRFGYGKLDTEIIGVVSDARVNHLREAPVPMAFYPLEQRNDFTGYVDVRAAVNPARVGGDVQRALTAVEPRLVVTNVVAMEDALGRMMTRDRLIAYVAAAFGVMALLLACVGLYGVMAYSVARRTQEIGVRAALGADPNALQRLVIREGMRVVVIGVVIGAIGAVSTARLVEGLLFGITPSDPLPYAAAIVTLVAVGLLASYLPARRAARGEPMAALRAE